MKLCYFANILASRNGRRSSDFLLATTSASGGGCNLALEQPNQHPMLADSKLIRCRRTEVGTQQTVKRTWRASPLYVSQLGHPQLEAQPFLMRFKVLRHSFGIVSGAFGNHHDGMSLAIVVSSAQLGGHGFRVCLFLGNDHRLGPTGDGSHKGQIATFVTHYLDEERAMVG